MLEPDLIAYLLANVLTVNGEVHLGNAPQNVPAPALVVIRTSGITPRTLNGTALYSRAEIQIASIGDDRFLPVMQAANEVRQLLDGFKGTIGNTRIESCRCVSEPADTSYVDGSKVMRQLTQDFRFVYRDA